jgi:hypothetical protein
VNPAAATTASTGKQDSTDSMLLLLVLDFGNTQPKTTRSLFAPLGLDWMLNFQSMEKPSSTEYS